MGKYDALRERALRVYVREEEIPPEPTTADKVRALLADMEEGWDPFVIPYPAPPVSGRREPLYMMDARNETTFERKLRMLRPLKDTCWACSMCELGQQSASRDYMDRDPHCFSNMNPTSFMIVGQNPGWNELAEGTPFVGAAGANFDTELSRHGLSRLDFYICNAVRCWTKNNAKPTDRQRRRCEPFLAMEIGLLKPELVVALGATAFESLCEGVPFADGLGKIVRSVRYGVPVFGVYHPSPRNLEQVGRKEAYHHQMRLLCGMVRAMKKSYEGSVSGPASS